VLTVVGKEGYSRVPKLVSSLGALMEVLVVSSVELIESDQAEARNDALVLAFPLLPAVSISN
jgi:hypothetical protein